MTTSSYASTALPPKLEDDLHFGTSDFSTDLGDIFSGVSSVSGNAYPPAPVTLQNQGRPHSPNRQPQPLQALPSMPEPQHEFRARSPSFVESRSTSDGEDLDAQIVRDTYLASQTANKKRSQDEFKVSSSGRAKEVKPEKQSLLQDRSSPSSSPSDSPTTASGPPFHPVNMHSQPYQPARQITPGPLLDSGRATSNNTTPRAKNVQLHEEADESTPQQAKPPASRHSSDMTQRANAPETPKRVMTGAEFERYKKEQELSRSQSNASKSESEDEDEYDDEDESERLREQEKLRRKQQADLAVHRQKMAKTTGQAAPPLPSSNSPHTVVYAQSNLGSSPAGPSGTSSEEEDDDTPLGVLMAHGFPTKNRPPNRLFSGSSASLPGPSQVDLLPRRPGSASGQSVAGGFSRANQPSFARNLPLDPHSGAYGLVSAANRESLPFNRDRTSSFQLQPRPASTPMMSPHGGLVGVIANEEAARAMRRGSPNAQGLYGSMLPHAHMAAPPQVAFMGAGGYGVGMSMPGIPQDMSLERLQMMQMNQQMMQMMAAQTQMMHNIAGGQGMQQPTQQSPGGLFPGQPAFQQPNSFLVPPSPHAGRPMSMVSNAPGVPYNRTNSMMNGLSLGGGLAPPAHPGFPAARPGYAKSLAPSERSNVGMSPRYRPIMNPDGSDNQTVITSSATPTPGGSNDKEKNSTIQATLRTVGSRNPLRRFQTDGAGDDEDQQGWSAMWTRRGRSKDKGRAEAGASLRELYPET